MVGLNRQSLKWIVLAHCVKDIQVCGIIKVYMSRHVQILSVVVCGCEVWTLEK